MKIMKGVLLSLALVALAGCAVWPKLASPSAAPFIQAGIDVAVTTAEQKGITAAQINKVAKTALAADSGTTATVTAIEGVVNAQLVALKLPPGDLAAAQLLMATLGSIITAELQKGSAAAITAQTQVAVATILKDVIAATGG